MKQTVKRLGTFGEVLSFGVLPVDYSDSVDTVILHGKILIRFVFVYKLTQGRI